MEEKEESKSEDRFEIKDTTKFYKMTLKKLIAIFLIIIILVVVIVYGIFYMYYSQNRNEASNNNKIDIQQLLAELKNGEEKTEEDFEEDVNYDYSDFLNSEEYDTFEEIDSDEYYYDEYNIEDEYRTNAELAMEYIYGLKSNPFYEISDGMSGYDLVKNSEKQPDGSYNIKIKFEELSENVYFMGMHPSCLKNNEVLKNNINIISDEQINVKDTGKKVDYWITFLSFDMIADREYKGYASIEEFDYDTENSNHIFAEVTVKFNSNSLVTSINYNEVPKENVPEELILDGYGYTDEYDGYSYSDYMSE